MLLPPGSITFDSPEAEAEFWRWLEEADAEPVVSDRQIVDIEPIEAALETLAAFNRLDLSRVELREGGKPIAIPAGESERFRVTGLSNKEFVAMRFWEGESNER